MEIILHNKQYIARTNGTIPSTESMGFKALGLQEYMNIWKKEIEAQISSKFRLLCFLGLHKYLDILIDDVDFSFYFHRKYCPHCRKWAWAKERTPEKI